MITSNKKVNSKKQPQPQPQPPARGLTEPAPKKAQAIKLGVDVHLDLYVVVRVIDGATPQPPQRFKPVDFMLWCAKQLTLAEKVFTCYEAGPFGYSLHRRLAKMGVTNYVIRPRDWDEYGKKVKTDKRDALAMALCLDRYVGGNREAFCVVRVAHRGGGAETQPLAPAGEATRGQATAGGPGTQSCPLLWRTSARRVVAGSRLAKDAAGAAGHRGQLAGTPAPIAGGGGSGVESPNPGTGGRRARRVAGGAGANDEPNPGA